MVVLIALRSSILTYLFIVFLTVVNIFVSDDNGSIYESLNSLTHGLLPGYLLSMCVKEVFFFNGGFDCPPFLYTHIPPQSQKLKSLEQSV